LLDVTLTATLRPEVVHRTLASFKKNLLREYRLIANLDITPAEDERCAPLVWTILRNTLTTSELRTRRIPNFPSAVIWAWRMVKSKYFLNLEDGWELQTPFDIDDMIGIMDRHPKLASLRFPKDFTTRMKCKQSASIQEPFYDYNGDYYECPADKLEKEGFYGGPSLIRTSWMQIVLPLLTDTMDVERQLRKLKQGSEKGHLINDYRFGVYSRPGVVYAIKDIGTEWREARGLRKNSSTNFTHWEKV
jgi:hypothetical protein